MSEKERSRFSMHLLRVGGYIAGFFWLAFVWGGIKAVSTPDTEGHSHLRGWALLIIAGAVMITAMDRWVKYLRVILGGGILGGLLATSEGHLLNGSPFPRSIAAALTAFLIGSSLISQTLAKRALSVFDRVALVAFLAAFVGAMVIGTPTASLIGVGIGFSCLLGAWAQNRLSRIPNHESEKTPKPHETT